MGAGCLLTAGDEPADVIPLAEEALRDRSDEARALPGTQGGKTEGEEAVAGQALHTLILNQAAAKTDMPRTSSVSLSSLRHLSTY
jgi:hypothetical protein